jgi:hypothetical protein
VSPVSAVLGQEESNRLVEFVCLDAHPADLLNAKGDAVATYRGCWAYCARGAEANHDWVRVPATPLGQVTTGKIEERPPAPRLTRTR